MKLNRTGSNWNELERSKINENWDIIEGGYNDVVGQITDEVVDHLIDSAKLNWKEPVETEADLPKDAEVGETRMVREADSDGISYVYRYDGENWEKIQAIDATLVNEVDKRLTRQLADISGKTDSISNADSPLLIKTYEGYNQAVHPDVKYFATPWNGYRYWMAYTPYPWTNDFFENPSIAVSNDGVDWTVPEGLTNPLDEVTTEEHDSGEHLSDAILVYREDINTLECWWRWRNKNTGEERFYRRTTTNGIDWTEKELIYQSNVLVMSPSVIYEKGVYRMWLITSRDNYSIEYTETATPNIPSSWSNRVTVPLSFAEGERESRIWHIHVYKERDNLYHATWNERHGSIYWSTSSDGMAFSESKEILKPTYGESKWDNRELYRASLTKVDDTYKLFYSAMGQTIQQWNIGLTEGRSMLSLRGSTNTASIGSQVYTVIPRMKGLRAIYDQLETPYVLVRNSDGGEVWLRLSELGRAGAGFKLGDSTNWIKVVNDNGQSLGNLEAASIRATNLYGTGGQSGLSLQDFFRVLDSGGTSPRIKLLHRGKYGATLTIDDPDVVKVRGDNESNPGHLEVGSLLLNGEGFKQRNGAIRYSDALTKFQGFVPSQGWTNLNNYVSTVPASPTSGGNRGDYTTDDNYLYVCHRPNNWFRFPKDTW